MQIHALSPRLRRGLGALTLGLMATGIAQAQTPVQNAVSFSTTATQEVTQDVLIVTLEARKDGSQAAEVQSALKKIVDAALTQARQAAQGSNGFEVRTNSFAVHPRYGNNGRVNGWYGSAQLVLQGSDTARISQTAGELNQLNVVQTRYGLSRALREHHEADLTKQAIERFRARAAMLAESFGFKGYSLGAIDVSSTDPGFEGRPMVMMASARAAKMSDEADSPLPVEPGKGTLSVTVNGQVFLKP